MMIIEQDSMHIAMILLYGEAYCAPNNLRMCLWWYKRRPTISPARIKFTKGVTDIVREVGPCNAVIADGWSELEYGGNIGTAICFVRKNTIPDPERDAKIRLSCSFCLRTYQLILDLKLTVLRGELCAAFL